MKIKIPMLWFTTMINSTPKIWELMEIDGLTLNGYHLLKRRGTRNQILEESVHKLMNYDGIVMMDSGGFQFLKYGVNGIEPMDLVELYLNMVPDYGVVLDYPVASTMEEREVDMRLKLTLSNTEVMYNELRESGVSVIPVIHGLNYSSVSKMINELRRIGDFELYGVGGMVPRFFNTKGVAGVKFAIKILKHILKQLQEIPIHVFGIGSSVTMHLMFYLGVSSIDSSSWRTKAAYGAIQLPGIGDRYVSRKKRHKKYKRLNRRERRILDSCICPACKLYGYQGLMYSFTLRAIHNAWVLNEELKIARDLFGTDEYKRYVRNRLINSRFRGIVDYIDRCID